MPRFGRILVPHDFSDHATKALAFAGDLVAPGGRILVLHVIVPFTPVTGSPSEAVTFLSPPELVRGAKRQLDRVVAKVFPAGARDHVDTKVVIGDPHRCILDAARGMDAIVMSTAGRTGLSHLLIGSVAEKVVRHSPIPVVTLRAASRRVSKHRQSRTRRPVAAIAAVR